MSDAEKAASGAGTAAEKAYAKAQKMIAEAKRTGGRRDLSFDTPDTHALNQLPPEIADLEGLRALDLNHTQITDAGLAQIAGLTGLRTLRLSNTRISDAGLAQIAGLTGLKWLALSNTQITDAGLAQIAGLTGLQTLALSNTQITDAGLAQIAGLTGLLRLALNNTQISDAGLAQIAGLTGLKELFLSNTQISDAGLAQIAGLTGLKWLDLDNTQITDAGLVQIAGLTGVNDLSMSNTRIRDLRLLRGFEKLATAPVFWGLQIAGCAAAQADARVAEIAAIKDHAERARALFDLIDAGWVPPGEVAGRGEDPEGFVPSRRPAPMEVVIDEHSIDLAQNGGLPKADANGRAAMGWAALKDYRDDFANAFSIGNYAPLPAYLAAFDRAMGDEYDAARVIRIGVQGRRFVALSLDVAFLQNLPDGAAADLKNFAAEVLIYLNRFPDWVAYRDDADDISPAAVRSQSAAFDAIRQGIDATPEASDAVKAEYAAEVAQGTDADATAEEATGVVASTGEFARAVAQAQKDQQRRNRTMAKRGNDLWDKTVVAPLGLAPAVALRLEAPMRKLSAAYPGRLGWIVDWYDVTFGRPEDRD